MYFKSRTDLDVVQLPDPVPDMGPAGCVVVDPDFDNPIVRVTDETTITINNKPSAFITPGVGGSADVNTWNTDSTMLYLQDSGGGGAIFSFDPQSMAVARLFPKWRPKGPIVFSRLDPNICFELDGSRFLRHDLNDDSLEGPAETTVVCDFASQIGSSKPTWRCLGGVEKGDKEFTAAFSTVGNQNTGKWACSYVLGKGYRTWNTEDGSFSGDYGEVGENLVADRFLIHNAKGSKDGDWFIVQQAANTSTQDHGPWFWNVDTAAIGWVGPTAWGGHWTAGYREYFNVDSNSQLKIPFWAHCRRLLVYPSKVSRLANPSPEPPQNMQGVDDHLSYNGPEDSLLVVSSANTGKQFPQVTPFTMPWINEILGFDLDGSGRTYRFCHHFSNTKYTNFYSSNAIAVVDQLNKFVAFCSNWMSTLSNGRGDTFIVRLR